MDLQLAGLRALVTGGTRGIGRADRRDSARRRGQRRVLRQAASTPWPPPRPNWDPAGKTVVGSAADVADGAALAAWVTESAAALGGIDILVANVSAMATADTEENWAKCFSIDLMGTVRMVKAALPFLEESNAASIVTISSVSGREVDFFEGPYGSIKAALIHYTQGLAHRLAPRGIRANTVSPGNTLFEGGSWDNAQRNRPEILRRQVLALDPDRPDGHGAGDGCGRRVPGQPGVELHQRHQPGGRRRADPRRAAVTSGSAIAEDASETGPAGAAASSAARRSSPASRRSIPDHVLHLASSTLKIVLVALHRRSGCQAGPPRVRDAARGGRRRDRRRTRAGGCPPGADLPGQRDREPAHRPCSRWAQPYHLPLLAVVSRRGGLGEYNSMIHTISERTEALLDAAGVRWFQLDAPHPGRALGGRDRACMGVRARDPPARVRARQPDGLLIVANLERADVLRFIDAAAPDSPIGAEPRRNRARDARGRGPQGKPLHQPGRDGADRSRWRSASRSDSSRRGAEDKVIAIEGDGSLLMGLSVLSTVGHLKPGRLVVYVLDNGVYLATGGQPTASADIDLVAVAKACSWRGARDVRTADELAAATAWALTTEGPVLIRVHIGTAQLPAEIFLEDPAILRRGFPTLAASQRNRHRRETSSKGAVMPWLCIALEPTPQTVTQFFSRDAPAVLTVDPGDTLVVRTLDARGHLERPERRGPGTPQMFADPGAVTALPGRSRSAGPNPGSTLAVHLMSLRPGGWGWTEAGSPHNDLNRALRVTGGGPLPRCGTWTRTSWWVSATAAWPPALPRFWGR